MYDNLVFVLRFFAKMICWHYFFPISISILIVRLKSRMRRIIVCTLMSVIPFFTQRGVCVRGHARAN